MTTTTQTYELLWADEHGKLTDKRLRIIKDWCRKQVLEHVCMLMSFCFPVSPLTTLSLTPLILALSQPVHD